MKKTTTLQITLSLLLLSLDLCAQTIQWADTVIRFSNEFKYDKYPQQYRAAQALGEPSVLTSHGSSPCAYTPAATSNPDGEFIEVGFSQPQNVQQVIINESFNGGATEKVELRDTAGNYHLIFKDDNVKSLPNGRLLKVTIERTPYQADRVKVYLKTTIDEGHNQIDAIGIVDETIDYTVNVNEVSIADTVVRENLGGEINSAYDELCPIISPDGKTLYFVRGSHPDNIGTDRQNIWFCEVDSLQLGTPQLFPEPINGKNNSCLLSITPDGQKALLLNIYNPDGTSSIGISFTHRTKDGWSFPTKVPVENYYNNSKYGEFTLASTGNAMISAIQRNDTFGNKDLYFIEKINDTLWTEPRHLGDVLNTAASEGSPFLAADDRTLYFSTSGLPGYGNNDIFMSKRIGDGWLEWSEPVNLGSQFNTPKWDGFYAVPADGSYVYFVSYDDSGYGKGDIYRAKMPESLRPQPIVLAQGVVRNQKDSSFISSQIVYHSLSSGQQVGQAKSDPNTGAYKIVLPAGDVYGFSAQEAGYIPISANLDLTEITKYEEVNRDLYLAPIEKGANIVINNLNFDTNKYRIRESSFVELNQLAGVLNANPTMKVLIGGHTDADGSEAANLLLSENRAKAVRDYLVEVGISADRLQAKGYGESAHIAKNDTDSNKQKNRRVEFTVVGFKSLAGKN
ncbi:MAG: OmpA family protein [Tunicatimonas sp.]|uniref:OmpA family protein n=1 Tax=Tunicatimonas sp. TaxID=1940096 RepID=UPI003C74009D